MKASHIADRPGMKALGDPQSLSASRILEVAGDSPDRNYYLVDVDGTDGTQIATIAIYKSGLPIGVQDFRDSRRMNTLPDLSSVVAALAREYRITSHGYYFSPRANFGDGFFRPLVVVHTTSGRLMVNDRLDVFQEQKVEKDPPGLARGQKDKLRSEQEAAGPAIFSDDGVVTFRHIGKIKTDR
jgi:hypothetical protein